jgi:hypothetical protein
MRTTLTLDRDVAALLRRVMASRKSPLKTVVNEALRHGLRSLEAPAPPQTRYTIRPVSLGRCLMPNVDNIAEVLAVAEGDWHK